MGNVIVPNQPFINFLEDMSQTVVIDANLIIPPDRSSIFKDKSRTLTIEFEKYSETFLEPLFNIFPSIAIHVAVYEEISNLESIKKYIDEKIIASSGRIKVLKDDELNPLEESMRKTTEDKIAQFTNYNPSIDNSADRGEVKSIAHAVAKNYIYFSTNDSNAISLLEREDLNPYLHSLGAIRFYEIIYAIRVLNGNSNVLKGLYKLMYNLTPYEKKSNPDWSTFNEECNNYYKDYSNIDV